MHKVISLLIITFGLFISCSNNQDSQNKKDNSEKELTLKYAKHFKIFKSEDVYRIEIYDRSKVIQEFRVSKNPESLKILKIPFKKIVATSTTPWIYRVS